MGIGYPRSEADGLFSPQEISARKQEVDKKGKEKARMTDTENSRTAVMRTAKAELMKRNINPYHDKEKRETVLDMVHERALEENEFRDLEPYAGLSYQENEKECSIKGSFRKDGLEVYIELYKEKSDDAYPFSGRIGDKKVEVRGENGSIGGESAQEVWDKLVGKIGTYRALEQSLLRNQKEDVVGAKSVIQDILS